MVEVYSGLSLVQEVERLRNGRQRHIIEKVRGISGPLFQLGPKRGPEAVWQHTSADRHTA
jgi:hypothetical protein